MLGYWIGKSTKRFGFSISKGSDFSSSRTPRGLRPRPTRNGAGAGRAAAAAAAAGAAQQPRSMTNAASALGQALAAHSDEDVLQSIQLFVSLRPTFREHVLVAMQQEPMKRYLGTIASFYPDKGFGFIQSDEASRDFGKDTFVSDKEIGPFRLGDIVTFTIVVNKDNKPQARLLQGITGDMINAGFNTPQVTYMPAAHLPATHVPATHVPATHLQVTHLPGTHLQATHIPATHLSATHVPALHVPATHLPATHLATTQLTATHLPSTHLPATHLPATHVAATHLQATHLPATHLAASHLPATQLQLTHLPPTHHVLPMQSIATDLSLGEPAAKIPRLSHPQPVVLAPTTTLPPSQIPPTPPPAVMPPNTEFTGRFVGTITSFFPEKHYGFISSEAAHQLFGKDTFLSDMEIGNFKVGDVVTYAIAFNKVGRPRARDLQPLHPEDNLAAQIHAAEEGRRYAGIISTFSQEKRYGFIQSPEAHAKFGKDTFLSDHEVGSFAVGSAVTFRIALNKQGRPQARDLQPLDDAAAAALGAAASAVPSQLEQLALEQQLGLEQQLQMEQLSMEQLGMSGILRGELDPSPAIQQHWPELQPAASAGQAGLGQVPP